MTKNYNKIVPNNLILFIVFMGFGVYYYCFFFFCRDTISLWDIPRELISKRNWFSQERQIAGYVEAPPRWPVDTWWQGMCWKFLQEKAVASSAAGQKLFGQYFLF